MVGFLKKILGGGQDSYYLQLDEDKESQSTPSQPSETKTEEKKAASQPKATQETKAPAAKPEVKKEEAKPQPKPIPAISTNNGKIATAQPKTVLFAPNNLMPTPTKTRRRPGPSLEMFKDMAKEVNPNIR